MQAHDGLSDDDTDWTFVSMKSPCPICGGQDGCRGDATRRFVCCNRISSQWPLSVGGWVHDLEEEKDGAKA
jgi:hypothetical protein